MVTPTLLKKWAYAKKAEPLVELSEVSFFLTYSEDLIVFINDQACPQRFQILDSFYRIVGKTVSKSDVSERQEIQELIHRIEQKHGKLMNNWAFRTRVILKDMRKYDYNEWCEGIFAKKDLELEI